MRWEAKLYAMVEVLLENDLAMGDFVDECDKMIYEGYFALGSPFMSKSGDFDYVCQAFVRKREHAV